MRIVENMGWLTLDKFLRLGLGLVVGIWVARHLGPEMFGALSFALAFVGIIAGAGTLGLQDIVIRETVRRPERAPRVIGTALALQAGAGLLIYAITIVVFLTVGPQDRLLRTLIVIVSAKYLFQFSSVFCYWFEALVQSRLTVAAQGIAFSVTSIVKIVLILLEAPVTWFAASVVGEAILAAILLTATFIKFGIIPERIRIDVRMARHLLRQSWPLIISAMAVGLAMRIDQVMIGAILEVRDVGYYAVAVRIAELLVLPGMIFASSIFPRLLTLDAAKFHHEYVKIIRYPFYLLLTLAALVALGSAPLVTFAFGNNFAAAAPALAVVAFSIPLTYISVMSSKYLLMKRDQPEILRRQLAGVIVNIGLNFVLIPRIGILGAAFATLLTDFVISIVMDVGRRRYRPLLALKVEAITGFRVRTE